MDMSGVGKVKSAQVGAIQGSANKTKKGLLGDGDFSRALDGALKPGVHPPTASEALKGAADLKKVHRPLDIKFSNHAIERMRSRGLTFSPDVLARIDGAVKKAASKGAKEALIITDNSAMIANVANKTIKTVMDRSMLKENIFTNIDAAMIV